MRPSSRLCLALVCAAASAAPAQARADDAACIAATEQSLPLRKQGKLHDALKQLAACTDTSCPAEVRDECAKRIGDVNAAMPTLILAAKDGSGNDLFDVKVSMDGSALAGSLDGRPLAIDPGEHAFRFEAKGQDPVEKKLVLREGEKDRREGVVIGPLPTTPATAAAPPPTAAPQQPAGPFWTTPRTLGVISGAAGVVGLGLGAYFGAFALGAQNREKTDCASSAACNNPAQGQEDYSKANTDATASTVSFVAGGVLLAAGVVLWFLSPSTESGAQGATTGRLYVAPSGQSHGGGVVFGGAL